MQEQLPYLIAGCVVALLSAFGVVLSKQPVHGAVALLVHSLALAGLYLLLAAEFVAIGQVIIYSGAIVVLFLFVVLLLPQGGREGAPGSARVLAAALGGAGMFAALAFAIVGTRLPASGPAPAGGIQAIGHALFGSELVPFELTTLPMLLAIVGAVTIWRRQEQGGA
ncbi:MAG TPA: NADH-quinone oxidoreductase subunit J [Planctomycetota bacterium]|nr:NADH-quinone oxidoreductase subunit J [Planctomycetota bacterium]